MLGQENHCKFLGSLSYIIKLCLLPKSLKNTSPPLGMPFVVLSSLYVVKPLASPPWVRGGPKPSHNCGVYTVCSSPLWEMASFLLLVAYKRVYRQEPGRGDLRAELGIVHWPRAAVSVNLAFSVRAHSEEESSVVFEQNCSQYILPFHSRTIF